MLIIEIENEYKYLKLTIMNKLILLAIMAVIITFNANAQADKIVYVTIPGTLEALLTDVDKSTVTNLQVQGHINAYDLSLIGGYNNFIVKNLAVLSLSDVTIHEFYGSIDGNSGDSKLYLANEIPNYIFFSPRLKSIDLPGSITSIENKAFQGCTGLTSINIPNGITTIGDGAFYGCKALTSLSLPGSIISIGASAFYNCSGLKSINIPNGSIGDMAFDCDNPYNINTIILGNGVTSIGNYAFSNSHFSSIVIPGSVSSIGDGAFYNNSDLTNLSIENGVSTIGGAFNGCTGLANVVIPNTVNSLGNGAFHGCTSLATITIGSGVTSIGNVAFYDCRALKIINILNTTPPTLGSNIFFMSDNSHPVTDIYVPNVTALKAYKANSDWIGTFPGTIIKTNATYTVEVPSGTNECYIAGISNGWTFQQLNKVDATHYNINMYTSIPDGYKYYSGPAMAYVEKDKNGLEIADRVYSANDVVDKWASVYTDLKTVNSNNIKLIMGKSTIRADFDGNARIEVCSLSGLLLRQAQATNTFTLDNLKAGLYVVKINGVAYKVVVK